MERKKYFEKNSKRLESVSQEEWTRVYNAGIEYARIKLRNRTRYGAHSEMTLGERADHHYVSEAVEDLMTGQWEWKESLTLEQQVCRIVSNKIQMQVKKWRRECAREEGRCMVCLEWDMERVAGHIADEGEDMEALYEEVFRRVEGNGDLRAYVEAIRVCKDFEDVEGYLGICGRERKNLQKRLCRLLKKRQKEG